MQKYFLIITFVAFIYIVCSCGTKPARESEVGKKSKKMESNQAPVTQKLMGLDNSVNTQWVAELPENDNFTVLTGRIGITGNEPFLNVALYINDQDSYLLSGNKKLMDYLTSQPLNKLTLAGEVYNLDKQKWIKVMYVKTK